MANRRLARSAIAVIAIVLMVAAWAPIAAQTGRAEIWVTEQSGTSGRLLIYDAYQFHQRAEATAPETISFDADDDPATQTVGDLCRSQTGSVPTRAHVVEFNNNGSHGIVSFVATGHVAFIAAGTRAAVGCVDVGAQAHAATAAPDGTYVVVANQNGKLLQRIRTNYSANTFVLDDAATINLATCTTPNGVACQDGLAAAAVVRPDTAPIYPAFDRTGRLVFVTLRGGGMFVVDPTATPMRIISEYDRNAVHANGLIGVESRGKMYVNSGGGDAANPAEFDVYSFTLRDFPASGFTAVNSPAPRTVITRDTGNHDAHGMMLTREQYLWIADRFGNTIDVVDTVTDTLVKTFSLSGPLANDPTPDLLALHPLVNYAVVSLRGPCPLTGNAAGVNNAVGTSPGVGLISIDDGGLSGRLQSIAPVKRVDATIANCAPSGASVSNDRADLHGIAVRVIPQP